MSKAPMAGSRKAEVYEAFHTGGLDAAQKKGAALGLKAGTVRSWCGGWQGSERQAPRTAKGTAPKASAGPSSKAAHDDAFAPHFKHASREAAERHREAIAKRSGCSIKAFHVIEEGGKFAVAPAHRNARHDPPQFVKGDIVFDTIIPNRRGKIHAAGPEQCEVKYPDNPTPLIIPNYYLYKFEPAKEGATKPKRIRAK